MFQLKTNAQYKLAIVCLKSYRSKKSKEFFNTHFLTLDFEDVLTYPNLLASHIICLNETRIRNVHLNSEIYYVLSQKFHILSCYDEHGTVVLYDDNVSLTKITTITNSSAEFITTFFDDNTWEALYIIATYKPLKMQMSHFNFILKNIVQKMLSHCSIVIIEDFNINFLKQK